MSSEHRAKKIKIMDMLEGYPSLSGANIDGLIEAIAKACADYSLDAVTAACDRFARGEIDGRNHAFPPSAEEVAIQARLMHGLLNRVTVRDGLISYRLGEPPPPGTEPAGIKFITIGGRSVDVSRWTVDEQDEAIRTGVTPKSVTDRLGNAAPVPQIQRM